MLKKIVLILITAAAFSQGAVKELIPNLTSDNLDVQTQARLDLMTACSKASAPDSTEAARKKICLEMCQILEDDYPVRTVIQPVLNNLERIGGEESVPTLVKLLNHKDEHIRDDARRALAVNPSPAAAQALGAQLKMRKARSAKTTAGLIEALVERRQAGASNLIVGLLNSPDRDIFIAAVKGLGYLNEDRGVQALFARRAKEQGFRKMEIEAALFYTKRKAVYKTLYAENEPPSIRATALLGLLLQGETGLAKGAMASGDAALQVAVIEAALQGKDKAVYDVVAAQIGQLPAYLQLQALGALEFSENRSYAKAVEPLLKSSDLFVQDNASRALARIGTADSVSLLVANGRPDARRALGILNVDGVDKALEKVMDQGDDNSRSVAITALSIRGRRDLIPTFFTYAAGDGKEAATSAAQAIGSIGDLSNLEALTELLLQKEKDPVSRDVLNAIVAIMRRSVDPAKAVDILVARLNGASPRSQGYILQALLKTDSKEALKPLANACRSADEQLQKSAVKMLSGWNGMNGCPIMMEVASDESLSLANHVVMMRGISRLLAKQRRLDRKAATQALEICRRPDERKMIQDLLDHKK